MVILNDTEMLNHLRTERERICFSVINRGKLWYDSLTYEQLSELRQWYKAWLNVTETKEIPITPNWVYEKVKSEEIIY
jgi:hypothetical protein